MPIGTLMKKIQFQLTCSVSSPPTSGPIASAIAETPAQMPIAVPRCRGGKVAVMIDSVAGFISAPPRPWTTRAPIRTPPLGAKPHAKRGGREDSEADHEDQPATEVVGELAAGQHEGRERERVAGDDPLELRELQVERALHGGQSNVDDGVVEHDHEQPDRDGTERPPLLVLRRHEPLHRALLPSLAGTRLADANSAVA